LQVQGLMLQRVPGQSVRGEGQEHTPPEQTSFFGHTFPQPPQLFGLVEGSMQAKVAIQLMSPVVEQGLIVVDVVVVAVVVVGPASGAQRSFPAPGVTVRLPN
jgi:hypothetical protein